MIRVIVADDEYKVCQLICQLINWEELDMRLVGTASNGIEALQMIKAEKPDLVLTDIRMPGYDGLELLKQAREINPDVEFIIISGYSHFEYAQTAIRYGVQDYILKPVNKETINATLQKVRQRYLEQKQQAEESLEQRKQLATDKARLRDTLWMDLEFGQAPAELLQLNKKYHYHFEKGVFQIFQIQADVKEWRELSEEYIKNIMELLNSKLAGVMKKQVAQLCIDSEIFHKNGKVTGLLNYKQEKREEVRNALELLISSLSRELQAFEHTRFHLGVSNVTEDAGNLSECVKEAEAALSQRLFVRNSLFLEELPEFREAEMGGMYKVFSTAIRQSLDLQSTEKLAQAVEMLYRSCLEKKLNGYQMLQAVQDAYHLFLLSGTFQSAYHFDDKEKLETDFRRKMLFCNNHKNLFAFLGDTCRRNMEEDSDRAKAEKARPINLAIEYIQKHYAEPLSLEEVGSEVGYSNSYFSTIFRKETGKTFLEYLTDVRIEEAKVLLRKSRLNIETISKNVGVNDYKRFSKIFKKSTGISPKEYRNLYS